MERHPIHDAAWGSEQAMRRAEGRCVLCGCTTAFFGGRSFNGGECPQCAHVGELERQDAAIEAGKDVVVDRHIRGTLLKLGFDLHIGEEVKIVVIKKAS